MARIAPPDRPARPLRAWAALVVLPLRDAPPPTGVPRTVNMVRSGECEGGVGSGRRVEDWTAQLSGRLIWRGSGPLGRLAGRPACAPDARLLPLAKRSHAQVTH